MAVYTSIAHRSSPALVVYIRRRDSWTLYVMRTVRNSRVRSEKCQTINDYPTGVSANQCTRHPYQIRRTNMRSFISAPSRARTGARVGAVYSIPRASLSEEALTEERERLTLQARASFGKPPPPFQVWSEDDHFFHVPRFYGITRFGDAEFDDRVEGEDVPHMTYGTDAVAGAGHRDRSRAPHLRGRVVRDQGDSPVWQGEDGVGGTVCHVAPEADYRRRAQVRHTRPVEGEV